MIQHIFIPRDVFNSKKGQLGPQALEDLPISAIGLICVIILVMLLLKVGLGAIIPSDISEASSFGQRALFLLVKSFSSSESKGISSWAIDAAKVSEMNHKNYPLKGVLASPQYGFFAQVKSCCGEWKFGGSKEPALSFHAPVSVLCEDKLCDGDIILRIWKK